MVRKTSALSEDLDITKSEITRTKNEASAVVDEASLGEKMDMILLYLHRMDRRDKLRTIGGFFRGMLGLIPLVLLLWSTWYFIEHGEEFMQQITSEAVKQSAAYSQDSMMDQLEQYQQYLNEQGQ